MSRPTGLRNLGSILRLNCAFASIYKFSFNIYGFISIVTIGTLFVLSLLDSIYRIKEQLRAQLLQPPPSQELSWLPLGIIGPYRVKELWLDLGLC